MIYWKGSLTPEERASLLPITFALSGRMIGSLLSTLTSLVGSFVPVLTFLSTISTSVSETRFFDKLLVYRWALTVHPYWLICSPHFRVRFHAHNNEARHDESRLFWLYLSLYRRFIQRKQRQF